MMSVNIQALRAIAALMVLFTHVLYPIIPMRSHPIVPWLDSFGPGGVDLFFVISGFIIYNAAVKAGNSINVTAGAWDVTRKFLLRRIIRIFPLYWIILALAALVQPYVELAPAWLEQRPLWSLVLLLEQPNYLVMSAWTLVSEVQFYAASVVILLFFPKRIFFGFAVWAIIIGLAQFDSQTKSKVWASLIFYEFTFGIIAAHLINSGFTKFGRAAFIIGTSGFFIGAYILHSLGGWFATGPLVRTFCFGLPSAFVVYGLVVLEHTQKLVAPKLLQYLGDASYSLYLWHQLVYAVLVYGLNYFGILNSLPREIYAVSFIAIAIAIGVASYRFIEQPILRTAGRYLIGEAVHSGANRDSERSQNRASSITN